MGMQHSTTPVVKLPPSLPLVGPNPPFLLQMNLATLPSLNPNLATQTLFSPFLCPNLATSPPPSPTQSHPNLTTSLCSPSSPPVKSPTPLPQSNLPLRFPSQTWQPRVNLLESPQQPFCCRNSKHSRRRANISLPERAGACDWALVMDGGKEGRKGTNRGLGAGG